MPAVVATTIALDAVHSQVDNEDFGGVVLGRTTTSLIGFYGVTTCRAQRSTGNNTALTTGANATVQLAVLTEIQTTLVNLGLMPST